MKIGVHLANGGPRTSPETIIPLAVRAEELDYDSVWVSDHVVIPSRIDDSNYPYGAPGTFTPESRQNFFEAFAVLAFIAGRTRRVLLGTSVLVLPQRQPLVVAKQWATLDALSGGRAILGVGAGWMREEFEALGVDTFGRRGAATDEAIRIYRAAWSQDGDVGFEGDVYRFAPLRLLPKPAQQSGIPIWVGGHGRRSIRRAAELGDGWQPLQMPLAELRAARATLHQMLAAYGRKPQDVVISMGLRAYAPGAGPDGQPGDSDLVGKPEEMAEKLRRYAEAGVEHAFVNAFPRDSAAAMLEVLELIAREVRPALSS